MRPSCPVPSRWALDELAGGLHARALEAAEREVDEARAALEEACPRPLVPSCGEALDRYLAAVVERNALRDGRP